MHVRSGPRSRRLAAVLAVGVATALAGCEAVHVTEGADRAEATTAAPAAVTGSALAALDELDVKGRAPRTGYERDRFGSGWVDTDRNGCDTRNDVLARDLTGETFQPGTRDCVVATGTLADPYSGETISFRRGQDTSDDVQVDHVVALSDAWQKGAQGWDEDRRVRFANDPLNLLAVDGPLNMQKGDGDAATWLPPDRGYRCAYVARQVAVKAGYGLWVTPAERDAMAGVLARCPEEPLPAGAAATTAAGPPPDAATGPAPRYADCAAVRAAGAAPIHRGEPGFSARFDGDGDGVGCES
ncbi:GmrSD restriction endonuclease domain-containing protein [Blastococcus sp. SYSU DS1024]